jgi:hypothetical protein
MEISHSEQNTHSHVSNSALKPTFPHAHWLIKIGLLWGAGITLLRGLRRPNDWAEAQWLISYDFGFLKRALPGTLLEPFVAGQPASRIETVLSVLSFVILGIFSVVVLKLSFDILRANHYSTESIFAIAVFLTSPFVVMSGHLNGYFDSLIIMLSCLAILLVLRGHAWAAAGLLTVGLFVHETILVIGFPTVLWAAWLYQWSELNNSRDLGQKVKTIARFLIPFALPLLIFVLLSVYQARLPDSGATSQLLATYLAKFGFILNGQHIGVAESYVTSFGQYLASESPHFLERVFNPGFIALILPGLLLLLVFARNILRARSVSPALIVTALIIPCLPLSLHLIAWDTSRIFTYPLIVAFLIIWTASRFLPVLHSTENHPVLFGLSSIVVIISTLLLRTPLMDHEVDRISNSLFSLAYLPVFLVLASVILFRHIRPPHVVTQEK